MGDAHSSPIGYVKIWAWLLLLLIISILGPMLGHPVLTLITAFGIALVKAFLVASHFMHLNIEKKIVWYMLAGMVLMVVLFFFGTAADVMKEHGHRWTNAAAKALIEENAGASSAHEAQH
jgi:caa(3)-type oxidase subunit IV